MKLHSVTWDPAEQRNATPAVAACVLETADGRRVERELRASAFEAEDWRQPGDRDRWLDRRVAELPEPHAVAPEPDEPDTEAIED